ncbi:hypothetical protein V6N12_042086 [Hibiscus sabdariffa]|uniref:Uncharacterized protein n=1 Tax=Hibiscus sabdariffa TaxID=183260 RepID=A0ABR2EHE4_9ROSI
MESEDHSVDISRASAVDPDEEDNKVKPSDSYDVKHPRLESTRIIHSNETIKQAESLCHPPHQDLQQSHEAC